jgi:hypothetical protein
MIVFFFLLVGDAEAAARLAELRAHFSARPKAESMAALEALARAAPATEPGGEAAAWRGALAQEAADDDGAARWFAATQAAPEGGLARRLGERGLGDLDLLHQHYADARRHFAEAARGASGALAAELIEKEGLARRLETRLRLEWAAWICFAVVLGYFVRRAWRGRGRIEMPVEAVYAAPVYALLVIGCIGRDAQVLRALVGGGAASLALIAVAGLATCRSPPGSRLRWLQAVLLSSANLALFYAVLNRTGLVDKFIQTVRP